MNIYQAFQNYLDIRGIEYTTKDNSLIQFKSNNWNFVMFYNEDDENYFRLTLPRIGQVDDSIDKDQLLKALNLSAEYKVAKMVIIDNSLWLSYEQQQYDSINTKLFDRGIILLSKMAQEWREWLQNRNKSNKDV